MSSVTNDLADVLLELTAGDGIRLRKGVVQAVTAPTVTIRLGGSTTDIAGVRYLASYTPAVGNVVFVLVDGPALLILGRLAT